MSKMIHQGLKSNQNGDIIEDNVVLGTVIDLKNEHDWLLARIHKLREILRRHVGGYEPLTTHQRSHDRHVTK